MVENKPSAQWNAVVELVEQVTADETLLPTVVTGVRSMVQEVASLPVADMAAHTRALMTAATRALAGRRGPTEAELAFVEELAVTRASQGIPIEVVLGAIHVAERAIWARARELSGEAGLAPELLLDARELYDDWAGEVRSRLIKAHRETRAAADGARRDRRAELLRRMLEGGSAATLAAAEAGFAPAAGLWLLLTRMDADGAEARLRRLEGEFRDAGAPLLRGQVEDALVAVFSHRPTPRGGGADPAVVAVAGPVGPEEISAAYRLALAVVPAAEATGRQGAVHVADVASVVALLGRPDLAWTLSARHERARQSLGAGAEQVAEAVLAWVEHDRDTTAAAGALFVHPNTVRNRLQRFVALTDIDPAQSFGALDAWWLCRSWLSSDPSRA